MPRKQRKCRVTKKGKLICPKEVTKLARDYGKAKDKKAFVKKNQVRFKRTIRAIAPVLNSEQVEITVDHFFFDTPNVRSISGFEKLIMKEINYDDTWSRW